MQKFSVTASEGGLVYLNPLPKAIRSYSWIDTAKFIGRVINCFKR